MPKIKSWEERQKEQARKDRNKALRDVYQSVLAMVLLLIFSAMFFLFSADYKVAKAEDIKIISDVIEKVDFREYQAADSNDKNQWAVITTSHGKYYYDFYDENTIEKSKTILEDIVQSGKAVDISLVDKSVRVGEKLTFAIDIRDDEKVYFSIDEYNEYQKKHFDRYIIVGCLIVAAAFVQLIIVSLVVYKKNFSGGKDEKRNRKSNQGKKRRTKENKKA